MVLCDQIPVAPADSENPAEHYSQELARWQTLYPNRKILNVQLVVKRQSSYLLVIYEFALDQVNLSSALVQAVPASAGLELRVVPVAKQGSTVILVSDQEISPKQLEWLQLMCPGLTFEVRTDQRLHRDVRKNLDDVLAVSYPPEPACLLEGGYE